ncbi:unnamed protein product [Rotaria sp. Silwood2]|nr:unnamed protein product [Rotaria sp. Silwood2]
MMNQYHHSETHTNFPSHHHHLHLNNTTATTNTTTIFQTPTTNYNLLDENYFYTSFSSPKHYQPTFYDSENSYEQYLIDNSTTAESIYHPIQSFDQCHNYSNNNVQLNQQSYEDFSLSNNPTEIIEQSSVKQQPNVVTETKYKWMQIKRTPAKSSGNLY